MDVMETILKRRSVRKFEDKPIPKEALDQIIEALRWAPSAGNLQSRFFYIVTNKEMRKALAEASMRQPHVAQAPICIVACTDDRISERYGTRGTGLYALLDVAAAIENGMLIAHSLGLGTCWIGKFNGNGVKDILKMPEYLKPVSLIPLGYPAETPRAPKRKDMKDVAAIVD